MFRHKKIGVRPVKRTSKVLHRTNKSQLKSIEGQPNMLNIFYPQPDQNDEDSMVFQKSDMNAMNGASPIDRDLNVLLSKSLQLTQGTMKVKAKTFINNKENSMEYSEGQNNYQTFNQSKQIQQQQNYSGGILNQVFQVLQEIKQQNQYLVERNQELEYIIEQDLKQRIEQGFTQLQEEIKSIKKINQNQIKRARFITQKRTKFQSTKKFTQTQPEQPTTIQIEQQQNNNTIAQLEGAQDSTFIRKLEQTNITPQEQDMRMSLGANLLQLMQANRSQKPKRIRNFNFRCNLEEIDKIIEDEIVNEEKDEMESSTFKLMNENEVVEEVQKINEDIMKSEEKKRDSSQQRSAQKSSRVQRKGWGQKDKGQPKMLRQSSKDRPKTAGIRVKRLNVKQESEDPILALLKQSVEEESSPTPINNNEDSHQIEPASIIQVTKDESPVIQNEQPINEIQEEVKVEETPIVIAPKPMQRKRIGGMFKAPPANLIEQLLLDYNKCEQQPLPVKSESPIIAKAIIEQPADINLSQRRLFTKLNEENRIRSPLNDLKKMQIQFDCDEDTPDTNGDENPFNKVSTLIKEEEANNLFFGGDKSEEAKKGYGDTAEFGK